MTTASPRRSDVALAEALVPTVLAAGAAVMEIYRRDFAVETKGDASPVTEADKLAEAIILADLARLAPEIPVVAEESCAAGVIPDVADAFFLVDPVDGTREFIQRNGDFTVNVALVRGGVPVVGLVLAPARSRLFLGVVGEGAAMLTIEDGRVIGRVAIEAVQAADGSPRIIASRSHRTPETDAFIAGHPGASIVAAGSSLKFCLMAAGEADLYPRLGPTMQWDTAAGDAVLRAAGGMVTDMDGRPLSYGPNGAAGTAAYANPWFLARGADKA
ncbi:3'(2'),5'-bisphosphate nucleotidase CysQ [Kaistia geumhonensis]|uniref:3'(2'),5'-bisphosphate nucleotidase CysQ n=1 Tax=Kaistia geumhonensis TaxID=410839 RepID=A0ABU0MAK6_9HYPH|nr:3'(2'),5'-bisphosphate nucleotidase CysQ [Kaistia geumhonensis]MCX5480946.1 3'(2'),5'-bisphosphate nucleotidase CysQ [Kaistia geumhonensis]MDQ0518003.1 3'(2'),5'-bisphosphate nucleotidase [Kaistia geumhonensis]